MLTVCWEMRTGERGIESPTAVDLKQVLLAKSRRESQQIRRWEFVWQIQMEIGGGFHSYKIDYILSFWGIRDGYKLLKINGRGERI
jgi:hypothetical protein